MSLHADELRLKLARNLAAARAARGLTQGALAIRAGISRATVVQIEGGVGDIKISTVADLAAALETSPILLLMGEPEIGALNTLLTQQEGVERVRAMLKAGPSHAVAPTSRIHKQAGRLGAQTAHSAGLSTGAAIGAAIGTLVHPGIGTAIGAVLGSLLGASQKKDPLKGCKNEPSPRDS